MKAVASPCPDESHTRAFRPWQAYMCLWVRWVGVGWDEKLCGGSYWTSQWNEMECWISCPVVFYKAKSVWYKLKAHCVSWVLSLAWTCFGEVLQWVWVWRSWEVGGSISCMRNGVNFILSGGKGRGHEHVGGEVWLECNGHELVFQLSQWKSIRWGRREGLRSGVEDGIWVGEQRKGAQSVKGAEAWTCLVILKNETGKLIVLNGKSFYEKFWYLF